MGENWSKNSLSTLLYTCRHTCFKLAYWFVLPCPRPIIQWAGATRYLSVLNTEIAPVPETAPFNTVMKIWYCGSHDCCEINQLSWTITNEMFQTMKTCRIFIIHIYNICTHILYGNILCKCHVWTFNDYLQRNGNVCSCILFCAFYGAVSPMKCWNNSMIVFMGNFYDLWNWWDHICKNAEKIKTCKNILIL